MHHIEARLGREAPVEATHAGHEAQPRPHRPVRGRYQNVDPEVLRQAVAQRDVPRRNVQFLFPAGQLADESEGDQTVPVRAVIGQQR